MRNVLKRTVFVFGVLVWGSVWGSGFRFRFSFGFGIRFRFSFGFGFRFSFQVRVGGVPMRNVLKRTVFVFEVLVRGSVSGSGFGFSFGFRFRFRFRLKVRVGGGYQCGMC